MTGRKTLVAHAGRFGAALALASLAASPATAQFGGLNLKKITRSASDTDSDGCPKGKKKDVGRSILGGIAGQIVGNQVSKSGVGSWVALPDFEDQLTKSIACKLDPDEQKQAAEATLRATRSDGESETPGDAPEVGSSAAWTSNTRDGVSGRSTVTGRQSADRGKGKGDCITVTDIIIVDGEETRAEKQMCRAPGQKRYVLVA